jgi:Ribonuclease G/E
LSERRAYLDVGVGETRAVVTLNGLPERLFIARDDDAPVQALGAQVVAKVLKVERALGLAFADLGEGPEAVVNLTAETGKLTHGQSVIVEIRAEARHGKGPSARLIGLAEGRPRLAAPAPSLAETLAELVPQSPPVTGNAARAIADEAEAEALETIFPLPGGGTIAVERTRALIAVDVDVGDRQGGDSKRATRAANLAALSTAARILRLKGEGGLVVVDLAGRGHDGPVLLAAARSTFAPDNPGVAFGPISRFGTLELTVPRRRAPVAERLLDADGLLSPRSVALRLLRTIEREALGDPGARVVARASPPVIAAAASYLEALTGRFGARLTLAAEPALDPESFEVVAG